MGFLQEFSNFINKMNPQMPIAQERLEKTIEKELCPLSELDNKVEELAKEIYQHPEKHNQEVLNLIDKLRIFSESPNPSIQALFKKFYPQFVPIKLDQAMESIKQKKPIDITSQEIKDLLSLKDSLPPAQLAILAHTFSALAEQLQGNKERVDLLKQSKESTLQQLNKTQVATFSGLQLEVNALKQKSYLSQEDRKAAASILLSTGVKDSAFDKILEEGSSTASSDYQAFKDIFQEESSFPLTIQGKIWTPSLVKTLITTHPTLEKLRQELGKKVLMEFADNESLELEPHQKYLLMQHSSIFYSLWTSGMKESLEGKVELENISKEAFSRILADLNQEPHLPSDEVSLLEGTLFCKEWGVATLAEKYEQELCILAKESSIEEILELNSHAFDLEKLKNLCQEKISSYLKEAFHDSKPQAFQDALNFLSPYGQSIDTLNLSTCKLSGEQLRQIIKVVPHLISLNLSECNITEADLKELSKLKKLTSLNLSFCDKITDAGLKWLSKLSNLTSLNLSFCNKITDAGLKWLSKLSNLTSLDLSSCYKITNAGLKDLFNLTNLTSLNLSYCDITDAHLKELFNFTNLTSLNLTSCRNITNAGLEEISKLSNLTSLNLTSCRNITNAGLEEISKLSNLTSLNLDGSNSITDAVLKKFSNLMNLTYLNLYKCNKITDVGLQEISNLKNLTSLNLAYCNNITDAGLKDLSKLKKLTSLDLSFCNKITDAAVQEFQTLQPQVEII